MEHPYRIVSANPLVIERAADRAVAFLEDIGEHTRGRTDVTLAGFDFSRAPSSTRCRPRSRAAARTGPGWSTGSPRSTARSR